MACGDWSTLRNLTTVNYYGSLTLKFQWLRQSALRIYELMIAVTANTFSNIQVFDDLEVTGFGAC